MAASDASTEKSGKMALIATVGALTVLAGIGGALVGKVIAGRAPRDEPPPVAAAPAASAHYTTDNEVHELPAIVTNLADPESARIRLQVAIVFSKKATENPSVLIAQVGDDLIAFMKTLSLRDIQGPSGLQNLREDLTDRVSTRSQGKVSEVIIEALVMQ